MAMVQNLNQEVIAEGKKKVDVLQATKDFKKGIYGLQWEHTRGAMEVPTNTPPPPPPLPPNPVAAYQCCAVIMTHLQLCVSSFWLVLPAMARLHHVEAHICTSIGLYTL